MSADSTKKQKNFCDKESFDFPMLSDENKSILKDYGAWGTKKMYGREYEGIIRSTFLINASGILTQVQEKVRPKGHVTSLLSNLANS